MGLFKRLGLWCAVVSGVTPIALNTPGLVPPGGRIAAFLTFFMGAAGVVSGLFSKQVFGKSDSLRLSENLPKKPHDRAADAPVPPPAPTEKP